MAGNKNSGRRPNGAPPKKQPPPTYDLRDEDLDEPLTPSEFDIEDFLAEWSPGTSIVEIFECKTDGTRPHCDRVDIAILKEDLYGYLREHHGAGKYLLQFKDSGRHIRKNLIVYVGGQVKEGKPGGESFSEKLLLTMIANQRPPAPLDMGQLMVGLAAMVTAMKPNGTGSPDPAAMLQAVTATFANLRAGAGPDDWMDKAQKMIAMARDLNPGGNGESDSWLGLAKEAVSVLPAVLGSRTPAPINRVERPAIPPGAVPYVQDNPVPEAQPIAPEKSSEEILLDWIKAEITFLKQKARAGKDPADWVDYVLENREEPGCAAILEAMRRGYTLQHLLTLDPEIGKDPVLSGFFQAFYEDLRTEFDKPMDTGGEGGDPANPGGNGTASTDGR